MNIIIDYCCQCCFQITVYANNSIYLSGCNDESENCDSEVLSPVTVVATDGSGTGYVNVTFDGIEVCEYS